MGEKQVWGEGRLRVEEGFIMSLQPIILLLPTAPPKAFQVTFKDMGLLASCIVPPCHGASYAMRTQHQKFSNNLPN